jgi:hypothetical protein
MRLKTSSEKVNSAAETAASARHEFHFVGALKVVGHAHLHVYYEAALG